MWVRHRMSVPVNWRAHAQSALENRINKARNNRFAKAPDVPASGHWSSSPAASSRDKQESESLNSYEFRLRLLNILFGDRSRFAEYVRDGTGQGQRLSIRADVSCSIFAAAPRGGVISSLIHLVVHVVSHERRVAVAESDIGSAGMRA